MDTESEQKSEPESKSEVVPPKEMKLVDVPIVDEITALNVMVSFLNLAQKRGSFSFDESAKIWECVKKFQRQ